MISKASVLSRCEWTRLQSDHEERVRKWTVPYRQRRAASKMHPVYDFLFIYYRNKPSQLEAWHPGQGLALENAVIGTQFKEIHYSVIDDCVALNPSKLKGAHRHRLKMALRLSEAVAKRPPSFGCFGMHEWAMVYRGDAVGEIRHAESLPLRLGQAETDAVVRSRPIQCTHFDAFRFFTEEAKPFNRMQPSKDSRLDNEQCGCLHTNMDLYKLAAQCMPWVGTDFLWKTFNLALRARELDMQASPYDCAELGLAPIKVETAAGKLEYERRQRALSESARPVRQELIQRLQLLLNAQ